MLKQVIVVVGIAALVVYTPPSARDFEKTVGGVTPCDVTVKNTPCTMAVNIGGVNKCALQSVDAKVAGKTQIKSQTQSGKDCKQFVDGDGNACNAEAHVDILAQYACTIPVEPVE